MIKQTNLCISVHNSKENPIYGAGATHIRVEDEAAGPFLIISQCGDERGQQEISLDFEELVEILAAAKALITQFQEPSETLTTINGGIL
jgi:hypothetical protein